MANEITVTADLRATKLSATIASGSKTKQITMAGTNMSSSTFTCHATPATSKQVTFGGVGSAIPGYIRIINLDDVAIVTLSGTTSFTGGELGVTLLPGQFALFPPTANALWCKSTVSNSLLLVEAVDL